MMLLAACAVRAHRLAGPPSGVEDHVEDEIDADPRAGLVDILADGVAVDLAALRAGLHHQAVVRLDGPQRAHSRHHRFVATTVAGEVMILDSSHADTPIGSHDPREHFDRGASPRPADRGYVLDVRVDAADSPERCPARPGAPVLRRSA